MFAEEYLRFPPHTWGSGSGGGVGRYIEVEEDLKGGDQDSGQVPRPFPIMFWADWSPMLIVLTDPKGNQHESLPRISDREHSEASGVSCIRQWRILKWVFCLESYPFVGRREGFISV